MRRAREPILLCAPGSGLGHLVRGCALALRLAERGVDARIVSNSPYAEGLQRLTGCRIDSIPSARWQTDLPSYVEARGPQLVVLDSFPWGLRGEWAGVHLPDARFVYLARRLKVDPYLAALELAWDPAAPQLQRVLVIEPLTDDHAALLAESEGETVELPGRIRFPAGIVEPPVPAQLDRMLAEQPTWLIIHSGPADELQHLIRAADEDRGDEGSLAAIVPVPPTEPPCPCFEYFPATALYARAHRVVSGAGYNLMAETADLGDKHIAIPFPRQYDDQHGRLEAPSPGTLDGAPHAARALTDWL